MSTVGIVSNKFAENEADRYIIEANEKSKAVDLEKFEWPYEPTKHGRKRIKKAEVMSFSFKEGMYAWYSKFEWMYDGVDIYVVGNERDILIKGSKTKGKGWEYSYAVGFTITECDMVNLMGCIPMINEGT